MSGFIQNSPTHSVASGINAQAITPTAIGNQLISVYCLAGTSPVPVAPTDSSGDTWTLLVTNNSGSGAETIAIAYLLSCSSTAARTITWASGASGNTQSISEWNGITAAGGTPVFASGTTNTTATSASYTPSQANEIVFAALSLGGIASPDQLQCTTAAFQTLGTLTDFGGHSCIGVQQSGASFDSAEHNAAIVTSASAITVTWTFLSNAFNTGVAGFKYTPGAGSNTASIAWVS